jgi:hypothetical protein
MNAGGRLELYRYVRLRPRFAMHLVPGPASWKAFECADLAPDLPAGWLLASLAVHGTRVEHKRHASTAR